jgi:hypothetical protein
MTSPTVRPPLTVLLRRFWRVAFKSQGAGFKLTAVLSAAVLAVGVGTAVVGFSDSGTSRLGVASGPSDNGTNGGPSASGPTPGASASSAPGSKGGTASGSGAGRHGTGGGNGGGTHGPVGCHNPAGSTDHGVTAAKVDVVIPIPNLGAVQSAFAFGSNFSSEDTGKAINANVKWINEHGGINCRQINPITPSYDPTDENGMRALCKKYTVDSPAFAFIDVLGSWHDANQLCVTQEEHTPLISPWTSTTSFLHEGAPNLWWTGPDLCNVLHNLVHWAVASHALTRSTRFGVVYTTSDADKGGYEQCLKPALAQAGLRPADTAQLTYSTTPNASTSQAPVYASRFHSERITTVIPMLPFFQFLAWIQGEQAQQYAPRLLLSDYDSMFQIALGLVGENPKNGGSRTPYTKQLQDQSGPTYYVLGNHDYPPYASSLGNLCNKIWLHYYPHDSAKSGGNYNVEATGTAMTACQEMQVFETAALAAGNNLTRGAFDSNMARLSNFPGGTIPNFNFGGGRAGPHQVRIVAVHDNLDDRCPKKLDGGQQGNCWLVKSGWSEQALS